MFEKTLPLSNNLSVVSESTSENFRSKSIICLLVEGQKHIWRNDHPNPSPVGSMRLTFSATLTVETNTNTSVGKETGRMDAIGKVCGECLRGTNGSCNQCPLYRRSWQKENSFLSPLNGWRWANPLKWTFQFQANPAKMWAHVFLAFLPLVLTRKSFRIRQWHLTLGHPKYNPLRYQPPKTHIPTVPNILIRAELITNVYISTIFIQYPPASRISPSLF